jgi:hypothetical protein
VRQLGTPGADAETLHNPNSLDAPMSEQDHCLKGGPNCKFGVADELALTEQIMREIKRYSRDKRVEPCPLCLRDTMLAVAALLHLEAANLPGEAEGSQARRDKQMRSKFKEAASRRLNAVVHASLSRTSQSQH